MGTQAIDSYKSSMKMRKEVDGDRQELVNPGIRETISIASNKREEYNGIGEPSNIRTVIQGDVGQIG